MFAILTLDFDLGLIDSLAIQFNSIFYLAQTYIHVHRLHFGGNTIQHKQYHSYSYFEKSIDSMSTS